MYANVIKAFQYICRGCCASCRISIQLVCANVYVCIVAMTTQAVATRDAMAKALYGALFDWIVDQVRQSPPCL